MSKADIIVSMLDAAAPVVKSYWTDLGHDARLINASAPGDTFLWAPREGGSHIIVLWRGINPNRKAAELYAAMTSGVRQWYYIELGQVRSVFETVDDASILIDKVKREASTGVRFISEIHM